MDESVDEQPPRRVPAKECFLNEIKGNETRIAVIVSVVSLDRAKKTAIVSDGTSEALLLFDNSDKVRAVKAGTTIRAIARPVNLKPLSLQVELTQELKDFDANLFKKVKALWAKL